MLTKEQINIFNQHFKIVEITHDISTHETLIGLDDFEWFEDNPSNFFLETDWICTSSDVTSSDGYSIQDRQNEDTIKSIFDIEDIRDFIENEMMHYLTSK